MWDGYPRSIKTIENLSEPKSSDIHPGYSTSYSASPTEGEFTVKKGSQGATKRSHRAFQHKRAISVVFVLINVGSLRFFVDCREQNAVTVRDLYL